MPAPLVLVSTLRVPRQVPVRGPVARPELAAQQDLACHLVS